MTREEFASRVTLGVSSKGNSQALLMCLTSVLTGELLPAKIQIRLEGKLSGMSSFYLEQLSDLARMRGVSFSFSVYNSTGVRDSRDWQVANCPTEFLWLVDDDVVAHAECLDAYSAVCPLFDDPQLGYLAGSKCDVNNRRSYPVFITAPQKLDALSDTANHSLVWDVDDCWGSSARTRILDTGNCMFRIPLLRERGCKFQLFEKGDRRNPSGDATTFSLVLDSKGISGLFVPSAVAYHLEKKDGGFNEFEARGEMLLRLCESKGFDKRIIKDYWMPGSW